MSSKGTLGAGLLDPLLIEVTSEVSEGSSHIGALRLDATNLLGVSIGSKSYSESSKVFEDFTKLVSGKLDLSEVHNT